MKEINRETFMNPEKYPLVYTYPKKSSRIFDSVYLQMGVYFFLNRRSAHWFWPRETNYVDVIVPLTSFSTSIGQGENVFTVYTIQLAICALFSRVFSKYIIFESANQWIAWPLWKWKLTIGCEKTNKQTKGVVLEKKNQGSKQRWMNWGKMCS